MYNVIFTNFYYVSFTIKLLYICTLSFIHFSIPYDLLLSQLCLLRLVPLGLQLWTIMLWDWGILSSSLLFCKYFLMTSFHSNPLSLIIGPTRVRHKTASRSGHDVHRLQIKYVVTLCRNHRPGHVE